MAASKPTCLRRNLPCLVDRNSYISDANDSFAAGNVRFSADWYFAKSRIGQMTLAAAPLRSSVPPSQPGASHVAALSSSHAFARCVCASGELASNVCVSRSSPRSAGFHLFTDETSIPSNPQKTSTTTTRSSSLLANASRLFANACIM